MYHKVGEMAIMYYVVKCSVVSEDLFEDSYGIMLLNNDGKKFICDISTSLDDVDILVKRLNEFHIEFCHLESIIEDYRFELSQMNCV